MAFEKLANFFGMSDDDSAEDLQQEEPESTSTPINNNKIKKNNVVSMNEPHQQLSEIRVIEPKGYADAKEISKDLLNNRAVLIKFKDINDEQMSRITDFVTGTVFAINGDVRRIDGTVFLCTPSMFKIEDGATRSTN